jgi:hypothetical protein
VTPEDVPDDLARLAEEAWVRLATTAPPGAYDHEAIRRHILAAVLPAHERQVREQVATAAAARLKQTMREWSAHEDDRNTCDAAEEHNCHVVGGEAAFNEAIRQVRQIAGGETR